MATSTLRTIDDALVATVVVRIVDACTPELVIVSGSTARGEAQAGGELDLLITLDPGRGLLDLVAVKQDLEDLSGCSVHGVADASLSPYLRDRVLRDVVEL